MDFSNISRSLLHELVTEHLYYKKLCSRWVPKMLTDAHKMKRMGAALEFLQHYERDGNFFFKELSLVMKHGFLTRHQKLNNSHCNGGILVPRKPRKQSHLFLQKKIMCTVFWDCQGILLVEFMERGATINAEVYCETLKTLQLSLIHI